MAGLSDKAIKTQYAENKYKFNGIQYNSDLGLDEYESFFRHLDPQIGRWSQIDPKLNEMLSPYSAMVNSPYFYSDPLGDTTWVFGKNGGYMGIVNDNLENQVHFMDYDATGDPFDASSLTSEETEKPGTTFRKNSASFIGKNTVHEMQEIEKVSTREGIELGFVGAVGDDKEIQLSVIPPSKENQEAEVNNFPGQISTLYTQEERTKLFLSGHVHHGKLPTGSILTKPDMGTFKGAAARFMELGSPSGVNNYNSGDYGPYLYRSTSDKQRGQAAALIVTPMRFTVYGSATKSEYTVCGNHSEGTIPPVIQSYFHYQQIKK